MYSNKIYFLMKFSSTKYTDTQIGLGLLLIRVVVGLALVINHGLPKINNYNTILEKWSHSFLGLPNYIQLYMIIFAEFACAALVVVGLFTRLACIPIIIGIGFAFFITHDGQIFGNGEMAGIFLTIFFALLITGPGKYSIDHFLKN